MIDYKQVRDWILDHNGATEETPFGPEVKVYKIGGKMFALVAWESQPLRLTVKCHPEDAQIQRSLYPAIQPGYHMNKEHWNTLTLDGSLPADLVQQLISDSYQLVISKLPRSQRRQLGIDKTIAIIKSEK